MSLPNMEQVIEAVDRQTVAQATLARHYAALGTVEQITQHSSTGLSGAAIWRVSLKTNGSRREYALRRWPAAGPPRDAVERIHRVLTQVANQPLSFIPAPAASTTGATCVAHGGNLWELLPWMPGEPVEISAEFVGEPSVDNGLTAAAAALAQFHLASQRVLQTEGAPPALAVRWDRLSRVATVDWSAIAGSIPRWECRQFAIEIASSLKCGIRQATCQLQKLSRPIVPLLHVVRDARREHFLFTDDEVTGLIDFGAMAIDSAMVDLARLVGDWPADNLTSWRAAIDAYEQHRPLSESERSLIDPLDASGTVLACCNWLRWLAEGQVTPTPLVALRLEHLCGRLARIC